MAPVSRVALEQLNPPQREAVTTIEGPLLVLAGAGSGKTRVITYRVAYLLENGASPDEILAVSFTNKAADEMRERVEHLVGVRAAQKITLSTFHALGLAMLKRERAALGFSTGFTVYDTADQLGVIREILRDVHIDDRKFDAKAILHRISRWKNAFLAPEELDDKSARADSDYDQIASAVYPKYQAAMRQFHALDFDDLIVAPVRLMDSDEGVRRRWQSRFRYVMIDEYQDTNRAQLLLVRHLAALHKNLCVVGDDDQSIYAWRGAESGNILEFDRHFPGAKVVTLEENYRSTPIVLEAANAVIAHNSKRHAKRLFTAKGTGDKIQHVVAPDAETEARFVAEEIDLLRERRGYRFSDCAILYRSNIQARAFEEALRERHILYRMIGGQAFYERKEVKDAIAYLKASILPRDEISLRRIVNYPSRGIGEVTLDRCAAFAATHNVPLWQALVRAPEVEGLTTQARNAIAGFVQHLESHKPALETGRDLSTTARVLLEQTRVFDDLIAGSTSANAAQRRRDNLEGFLVALDRWERRTRDAMQQARAARQQAATPQADLALQQADTATQQSLDALPPVPLGDYLHRLTLSANDDDADDPERSDQVTLVTLHGAKGLEYPVVFLVGLEEELLPHRRTLYPHGPDVSDGSIDLSEERRLLYVGITRAREILYLTRCRSRGGRMVTKDRTPSRFLDEIPPHLYDTRDLEMPTLKDEADEEAFGRAQLAKLKALFE